MAVFDIGKFNSHMKDPDKDLREMALFDLHQALKIPNFNLSESDSNIVTHWILNCFSSKEPEKGICNSAIQVVPLFFLVSGERQQNQIVSFLCKSATAHVSRLGERGYSDVLDSSAFALKLCCESIADAARGRIEKWQSLSPMAININDALLAELKKTKSDIVKDTCYSCINSLLDPYGRVYSVETRDELGKTALLHLGDSVQARRRAIACLSLLAPMLSESAFAEISWASFDGLKAGGDWSRWHWFNLLCESLVRSSPHRAAKEAFAAMELLLKKLQEWTGGCFSEKDDACDAVMRLVGCLVSSYPRELSSLHEMIFDQCIQLVNFDPNYCGEMEDSDPLDEYYVDEEVDSSWKLRVGAAKVLSFLLKASSNSAQLVQRLKPENLSGVTDRVEGVQLACLHLVNTVIRESKKLEFSSLSRSIMNYLIKSMSSSNQKVSVAVATSIQQLLHDFGEKLLEEVSDDDDDKGVKGAIEQLIEVVVRLLHDKSKVRYVLRAEIVVLAQRVIEVTLIHGQSLKLAERLSRAILEAGGSESPSKVNLNVLRSMKVVASVALLAGYEFAEYCVALPLSFLEMRATDRELRRAALEALKSCIVSLSSVLSATTVSRCVQHLVSFAMSDAVGLQVLRSTVEQTKALIVSPEVLEDLCEYPTRQLRSHQQLELFFHTVCDVVSSGCIPTRSSLHRLTDVTHTLALPSNDPGLIQVAFDVLKVVCQMDSSEACRVMDFLPAVWDALQSDSLTSGPLHIRIVESATCFFRVMCHQLPDKCVVLEDALLERMQSLKGKDLNSDLIQAFVCDRDPSTLLAKLPSLLDNESLVCLCAGAIGRCRPLPETWKMRLLGLVEHATSEAAHRCGAFALGRAASNAENADLVREIVARVKSGPGERSHYLKALKEVMQVAASSPTSSFSSDPFLARDVGRQLLENPPSGDEVEMRASVLGYLAPFALDDLLRMTEAGTAPKASENITALCLSVQRYLISYCKMEEENALFLKVVSVSLQSLQRTASVPIRVAALQLFAAVVTSKPHLLFEPWMSSVVYPSILAELREDPELIMVINLGSYTHREDKGLEVRKLAFECISFLLRFAKQQKESNVLQHYGRIDELLLSLVHACGPQDNGEVDEELNNQSRTLIVYLVKAFPNLVWDETTMDSLLRKLKAALEVKLDSNASGVEKKKTLLMYAVSCVMTLSECAPFIYSPQFHFLLQLARQSPLLAEAVRSTQ